MGKDSIKEEINHYDDRKAKNNFFKYSDPNNNNNNKMTTYHRNSLPRYEPRNYQHHQQMGKKTSPRKNSLRNNNNYYNNNNSNYYFRDNKENNREMRNEMGEEKREDKKNINMHKTISLATLLVQQAEKMMSERDEKREVSTLQRSAEEDGKKSTDINLTSISEMEALLNFGASPSVKLDSFRGCTLLHIACGCLHDANLANLTALRRLLAECEAEDMVVVNDDGYNVLHWAVEKRSKDMLKILMERLQQEKPKNVHTLVNEKAGSQLLNRTPLHIAAISHDQEMLRMLVQNNADGNIRDFNNQTSFELALLSEASQDVLDVLSETTKVVKVMKKCLNNFSIRDCRNVIFKLAKMGVNFKLRNRKNNTPLMIAAQFGDADLLQQLIQLARDHKTEGLEALDDNFHTALHFSCSWGHFECVKLLLDAGANIEATDNQGNTPLCRAAQWNRADVCGLLLERGANANAVSSFNKTPLELAFVKGLNNCENPHWDVIQVLLPYTDLSKLLFHNDPSHEKMCFYAR